MSDPSRIVLRAQQLDEAWRSGVAIPQSPPEAQFDLASAYAVQQRVADLWEARGARRTGIKQGFTSAAMRAKMGIPHPALARLYDFMAVPDGGTLALAGRFAPRLEVEVVFRLGAALPAGATRVQAQAAIAAVAAGIEIIDGRYANFRFSMTDVVADATSACAYVIGPWRTDLPELGDRPVTLAFDGTVVASGNTAVVLGHPLDALCHAAGLAAELGVPLKAGDLVFAGSAIDPVAARPGARVSAVIDGVGAVSLQIGL